MFRNVIGSVVKAVNIFENTNLHNVKMSEISTQHDIVNSHGFCGFSSKDGFFKYKLHDKKLNRAYPKSI